MNRLREAVPHSPDRRRLWRSPPWRRPRPEALPITFGRKRIYLFPTGFGFAFAIILVVMLVGALNYTNNAALLLTCLLTVIASGSALSTFRNMNGVRMETIAPETAHAGKPIHLALEFSAPPPRRHALVLRVIGQPWRFDINGQGAHDKRNRRTVEMSLPTTQRGWMAIPDLRLGCTWPFGLFRAWVRLQPDCLVLVYPRMEHDGPPPGASHVNKLQARRQHRRAGGDDLAALRRYHPGDPRKHVAWKASARHEHLLVREFQQQVSHDELELTWQQTQGLEPEARISRLARWVDEAHAQGLRWSLEIPGHSLGPDGGLSHYHRCMRCLALLPLDATPRTQR